MKKTILGLAIIAMALVSPTTYAQNKTAKKEKCSAQTEQVCKSAELQGQKKDCKKGCEFEGLNLTDAQKQQLQAENQDYTTLKKSLYQNAKDCSKDQRDSLRGDVRKKANDLKKNHLNKIKTILTADQYVVFLENNYMNGSAGNHAVKAPGHGKPNKDGFKGKGPQNCKKENCKLDNCKKDNCKKENCKLDNCKKDNCKKENCKKDNCKKDNGKQCDRKHPQAPAKDKK